MFPGKWVSVQTWTDNICSAEVQEEDLDLKAGLIFNLVKFNQRFSPLSALWLCFRSFKDSGQRALVSLVPPVLTFYAEFPSRLITSATFDRASSDCFRSSCWEEGKVFEPINCPWPCLMLICRNYLRRALFSVLYSTHFASQLLSFSLAWSEPWVWVFYFF